MRSYVLIPFMVLGGFILSGYQSNDALGQHSSNDLPSEPALKLVPSSDKQSTVDEVQFSPTGQFLATRDAEQVIRIWEIPSGRERYALSGDADRITSIAFSPDERFLATASPGLNEGIHVWDMSDGNLLRKIPARPTKLAFETDGSLLTADPNGYASYDIQTGQARSLRKLTYPKRLTEVLALEPQRNVLAYVVSTQLRNVVPHEVVISNLESGHILYLQTSHDVPALVAISPNGEHTAICYRRPSGGVLLASLIADIDAFPLPGHQRETLFARFSSDSRMLATASWDGVVRLWDVLTGSQIASLAASSGHALAVDFSPTGKWMATAGANPDDNPTLVWDLHRVVFGIGSSGPDMDASSDPAVLMQRLAARDVPQAYQSIGQLYSWGDRGLEIVRSFVRELTTPLSDDQVDQLIGDLNSDSYQTRVNAYRALLRVRRVALSRLASALRADPTLEVELRLKKLLSTNEMTSLVSEAEYRQLYRIIQLLELFATEQARSLISELASGHADGRVSSIANQALQRMAAINGSESGA